MNEQELYFEKARQIIYEVKKSVIGKDEIICKVLMAMLANGHVLIEDIPGVGKTTMVLAFAKVLGLRVNRMQFTPDVMPSDITGFNMFNRATNRFEFRDGAANCNILLADEINRTSPKTQSALLQIMEEKMVTVDGVTYELPRPFVVMATQNPYGEAGTQKLPESQLDRFMIKLSMGYPEMKDEIGIYKLKNTARNESELKNIISADEFMNMQKIVSDIHVDDSIYEYVARLVKETRQNADVIQGISPRGGINIVAMAKSEAFLRGRNYVVPLDVQYVLQDTMAHRLVLNKGLRAKKMTEEAIIKRIVDMVPVPDID